MARGNSTPTGGTGESVLYQAARNFHGVACEYTPRGMLEVRAEAYELPDTLGQLADALRVRAQANAKESLHPDLPAAYAAIADAMQVAAQTARQLGPAFDAMHKQLVDNLTSSPNPAGWDSTSNGVS